MPLLDHASNIKGPMTPDYKKAIYRYLQNPSVENWDAIHCIILCWNARRKMTVWQALIEESPRYAYSAKSHKFHAKAKDKWAFIPDAITLARAIKKALDN
jgi:hypothetical protein